MKKVLCLLLVCLTVFSLSSCSLLMPIAEAEAVTYVTLRVNPEIALLADENGIVLSAAPQNEDGAVVLAVADFVGISLEKAAALFAETAEKLDYLVESGEVRTVFVGVASAAEEKAEALKETLAGAIEDFYKERALCGQIVTESLEEYGDKALAEGITRARAMLVDRVLAAYPEMTEAELKEKTTEELLALLYGAMKEKTGEDWDGVLRDAAKKLEEEGVDLSAVRESVKELYRQFADSITEEDKAAIREKIDEFKAELPRLAEEFRGHLPEILEELKEGLGEIKTEYEAFRERLLESYRASTEN